MNDYARQINYKLAHSQNFNSSYIVTVKISILFQTRHSVFKENILRALYLKYHLKILHKPSAKNCTSDYQHSIIQKSSVFLVEYVRGLIYTANTNFLNPTKTVSGLISNLTQIKQNFSFIFSQFTHQRFAYNKCLLSFNYKLKQEQNSKEKICRKVTHINKLYQIIVIIIYLRPNIYVCMYIYNFIYIYI